MPSTLTSLAYATSWLGRDVRAASAIEYGILAAGIVAVIIVTVFSVGPILDGVFNDVLTQLQGGGGSP